MSIIQTPSSLLLPGQPPDRLNPLAQGLVGAWPLDEGAGTIAHDLSGHGNHGTTVGTTWVPGPSGSTQMCDAAGEYIDLPGLLNLPLQDFTITSHIITTGGEGSYYGLLAWEGSDTVLLYPDDAAVGDGGPRLYWRDRGGSIINVNDSSHIGEWQHIAVSRSGDVLTWYVDGSQVAQEALNSGGIEGPFSTCRVGDGYPGQCWYGQISYLCAYNRALTASEVQQLYVDPDAWRRPVSPLFVPISAAGGGLSIPVAMHHYRTRRRAG